MDHWPFFSSSSGKWVLIHTNTLIAYGSICILSASISDCLKKKSNFNFFLFAFFSFYAKSSLVSIRKFVDLWKISAVLLVAGSMLLLSPFAHPKWKLCVNAEKGMWIYRWKFACGWIIGRYITKLVCVCDSVTRIDEWRYGWPIAATQCARILLWWTSWRLYTKKGKQTINSD